MPYPNKSVFFPSASNAYPLVSIGIPTYNGGGRILKALQSVWDQHYPNIEIVISDNCSQDHTAELLGSLVAEHRELRYYRQSSNIGLVGNFEFVLRHASGKYFMWVADDDAIEPGVLFRYVWFLENQRTYSLVSGSIQYWKGSQRAHVENGFTFEQQRASLRCIGFYFKVVYGGMFHGMMRREIGEAIPCRNVYGNDYHFVASLAFAGKVKNLDFTGYNKWLGGTSRDNRKYVKVYGESWFTAYFPHVKMAYDAFAEVMYRSPVFRRVVLPERVFTALGGASGILCNYGFTILPFTIGGIIKRSLFRLGRACHAGFIRLFRSRQPVQAASTTKTNNPINQP